MTDTQLVFPGDFISTSEEHTPGPGVFEENGNLYACQTGLLKFDDDEFKALVEPVTDTVIKIRPSMEIIGQVFRIKESAVVLKIIAIVGQGTRIDVEQEATLHVSKVAQEYVDRLRDRFRLLDTVRAGVLSVDPSVQVETAYDNGGVVTALCGMCRKPLVSKGRELWCEKCERTEYRQLSAAYGQAVT